MVQSAGPQRGARMGARQIYEALRDQILDRAYGVDGQLPSSRALAGELGVSRSTVTVAYEQLVAEGFIDIRHGARPRVAADVVDKQISRKAARSSSRRIVLSDYGERLRRFELRWERPQGLIADFRYGDLAPTDFPTLVWKKAVVAAISRRPDRLAYDDPAGSLRLRTALQGYLWRSRTVRCGVDQIIVVNGSQQGLDLCARLLLDAGDRFVIEDPGYLMARRIFAATGATAVPLPVDEDGLETDRLATITARLAYVTPSHQFPLGGVMPVARRHQLLAWAEKCGAYLIEDDYDSEYRYDTRPVPPLHALDAGGAVIYVGTISKTLSPTLRIGYLVVPPELRAVFTTAKQMTDRHTSLIEQEALAALLESGAYDSHVNRVRRHNGRRRKALLDALHRCFGDRIEIQGAAAGLHLVVWLRDCPGGREQALIAAARELRVGIHPVAPLFDAARRPDVVGLVMGYASLDERRIERGCQLLAQAVQQVVPPRKRSR